MWRVNIPGGNRVTTIFLIGVTHIGLPVEHDDYLQKFVIPAFDGAKDLYFENSDLPIEQQPACKDVISGAEASETLRRAREFVRSSMVRFRHWQQDAGITPKVPDAGIATYAEVYANMLSDFGLYEAVEFFTGMFEDAQKLPPGTYRGLGEIVPLLVARRPDVAKESLDGPKDVARAFCAVGPYRIEMIREKLDIATAPHTVDPDGAEAHAELMKANENFIRLLRAQHGVPGFDVSKQSALTCLRNSIWMNKLANLRDGRSHFVAVGAAHLFATGTEPSGCRGLLADFAALGFQPQLVH
jgi:uncharacterized protein YbaP (TraB family)